ncbi:MAG: metal-dependent transcriptional regulator [Gracilibacteraceae bacterium]|jgi:Mn-dependent DtxR family transcriptional regulator|nr:metal-dependent transcriptional regulator [Gracilibacteraceae bacterium]
MEIQESGEMYLETILLLTRRNGSVRSVEVANELGYSKPSVSRAMNILREGGFITVKKPGFIFLTPTGQAKAAEIHGRHQLITAFLTVTLGVNKTLAERDACRMEHIISEETVSAMKSYILANHSDLASEIDIDF